MSFNCKNEKKKYKKVNVKHKNKSTKEEKMVKKTNKYLQNVNKMRKTKEEKNIEKSR